MPLLAILPPKPCLFQSKKHYEFHKIIKIPNATKIRQRELHNTILLIWLITDISFFIFLCFWFSQVKCAVSLQLLANTLRNACICFTSIFFSFTFWQCNMPFYIGFFYWKFILNDSNVIFNEDTLITKTDKKSFTSLESRNDTNTFRIWIILLNMRQYS